MKYLSEAIIDAYGFKEGLCTREGVVTAWPYAVPQPSNAELETIRAAFEAIQDADQAFREDADMPSLQEKVEALLAGGAALDDLKASIAAVEAKHGR